MLIRPLINAAICVTFCANFVSPAGAAGLNDPFSTADLLKPPTALAPSEDGELQPCSAPGAAPFFLTDVVNRALCGNPQTREVWANARAQATNVGRAKAAYLPSLDASLSASRNKNRGGTLLAPVDRNQRNYDLSLSWLLYDFGGREASMTNAMELLTAANATQDATVQALFLNAVKAYYQLQASEAAGAAAAEAEKAALESLNAADARYKVGVATPADKLQAQTAHSQALLNRISADGNLQTARGTLANVMGLNAASDVQLAATGDMPAPAEFDANIRQLIDEAMRRRPDLLAAEARARAAQAAVNVARASGRPSVSLGLSGGDVRSGGLPDAKSTALGLTLNIPLFSGFDTTYKIRAAEAQAQANTAQSEAIRLQVGLDVWNNYQALSTATQTIRSSADLLASAEQSQRMALGRYKAGMGSILDVLNAQSALASARQQRVQALYNWNVTRVSLAKAMGSLDRGLIESLSDAKTP